MEILHSLNLVSITVRLLLALACGGVLGMDRERNHRPAGFRTYTLVCSGAALVMMTSQYVLDTMGSVDVLRMGAQVVSGIGFLGAGTIIVTGKRHVRGLTTAAGLWAAACIGLAAGIGFYAGALLGTVVILLVFSWFHYLGNKINRYGHVMNLYLELQNLQALGALLRTARENKLNLSEVEIDKNGREEGPISVLLSVSFYGHQSRDTVLQLLGEVPGVCAVEPF